MEVVMKKIPSQNLKKLVQKCISDPAFFNALVTNPKGALYDARMFLVPADLSQLKRLLKDKKSIRDFRIYSKLIRKYGSKPQGVLW
jgi:hypothetical protein